MGETQILMGLGENLYLYSRGEKSKNKKGKGVFRSLPLFPPRIEIKMENIPLPREWEGLKGYFQQSGSSLTFLDSIVQTSVTISSISSLRN